MGESLQTVRDGMLVALRSPRGRYTAERASQLSGIPKSTLYEWRSSNVWRPDYSADNPVEWSYRDLVFVRLLAKLRQHQMPRDRASDHAIELRTRIEGGARIHVVRTDHRVILVDDKPLMQHGETPFEHPDFIELMESFELTEPIDEFHRGNLWGPDLVAPSNFSYISPWVMAGDPCITRTRIPTASVYALGVERRLPPAHIVELYPGLTEEMVNDARQFEQRLRREDAA